MDLWKGGADVYCTGGADWMNREVLLGYPNALNEGEYVLPENSVLNLLIEANKLENQDEPCYLILDEVNLSYAEG